MKIEVTKMGFTLIELLVVLSIIGVLSAVTYVSFNDARKGARDDIRMAELQSLQVALELYKSQYGVYPDQGCAGVWTGPGTHDSSWGNATDCPNYIVGHAAGINFVPDFIAELPTDPNQEDVHNKGFLYRVTASNDAYKVLVHSSVESKFVMGYENEFARCPRDFGSTYCGAAPGNLQSKVYAVYSAGVEHW